MSANNWESRIANAAAEREIRLVKQMSESPIEEAFLGEMVCRGWEIVSRRIVTWWLPLSERVYQSEVYPDFFLVHRHAPFAWACPQAQLDDIGRVDLFVMSNLVGSNLIVELDGHDFHNRTKAQAQRDRTRDRHAVARDIRVVRFTGSEIHANAGRCVQEMMSLVTPKPGIASPPALTLESVHDCFAARRSS